MDQGAIVTGIGALRRRRSAKWSHYPPDVLPAWVAEMDFELAPPVRDRLREAIEVGDCGYAAAADSGLAESLAGFAERRMGWSIDPAAVATVGDVVSGLADLVAVLSEPGEGIIVTPPVYHPFFSLVAEAGRRVVEVPLVDGMALDLEAIDRAFAAGARAIIICSPHNPTGRVLPRAELEAVAESAERHGGWVLADEIHAPLTLSGATHVPFLSVGEAARRHGFALVSASKTFNLAGLKCAQIVTADPAPAARVERIPSIAFHPGHLGVLASAVAFAEADEWLDGVLAILDHNRGLLGDLLAERLPGLGYERPQAGYLAWLDFRALDLEADPAALILERGRLALSPGPQFGTGGEGFGRLNIGTSPELVAEAVERIAGAAGQ